MALPHASVGFSTSSPTKTRPAVITHDDHRTLGESRSSLGVDRAR